MQQHIAKTKPASLRSRAVSGTTAGLAGLGLAMAALPGTATAAPVRWESYHDEYGPEVSFCGPNLEQLQQVPALGAW